MMKYVKWKPIKNLSSQYICQRVYETDDEGYFILLESTVNSFIHELQISFGGGEVSYRVMNGKFENLYEETEFFNWSFYRVEQSDYIKWIDERSCGLLDDSKYTHYFILTENSIIDVITLGEPTLKIIEY